MQTMTNCIWFDGNAEEAVDFYLDTFKESKKGDVLRYGPDQPLPEGTVLTIDFELNDMKFLALNAGPEFKPTPGVSFMIGCETQDEIDHYWDRFCDGGETMACGWVIDRFGVTWQVTPECAREDAEVERHRGRPTRHAINDDDGET